MTNPLAHIHPELQPIAKRTPSITFSNKTLWLVRMVMNLTRAPQTPPDILLENKFIPSQDGQTQIRLRIYKPHQSHQPIPVLLWLHGGGYVMGKPEMDDRKCFQFVRQLGIAVVSVDYRHAPKHPFPAGLEDSYAALKWVQTHAPQLGLQATHIALGGASAGGGLAAALAQLAHDRQEIKPIFQLLIYPMLDDRTVTRSDMAESNHLIWNQKSNRFGWESYLGQKCGAENMPAYAVPARRQELSGLPPAWIGVGTEDLFYEEDLAYARKLQEAGVPCETHIVQGAFHGFDATNPQLTIVQEFQNAQIAALKKYMGVLV